MDDGAPRTARARVRAEVTSEIVAVAREHLAEHGAAGLSLRAVARDLGMASSAIYRYFPSRDDLLTALIVEAYDALGTVAEAAAEATSRRSPRNRWLAVARAIRAWALDHPHQYALLYGSPVPGYAAPELTTASGVRVTVALVGVVADAARTRTLTPSVAMGAAPALRPSLDAVRAATGLEGGDEVIVATLAAWTQLFGLLSFEVFGQTRGAGIDHEALFDTTVGSMAAAIGL